MSAFDDRELCPDGACVGVIGDDGRCAECGAVRAGGAVADKDDDRDDDEGGDGDDGNDGNDVDRELCPDGGCVGVIGPDGVCKECGKPGRGGSLNPRTRGMRSWDDVADELSANIAVGDIPAAPGAFDDRELCPDGGCIGIIGADGRCRECGTSAT